MSSSLPVREAIPGDVPSLTRLIQQLGYPLSESVVSANLLKLLETKQETILVAVHEEEVIAWIGMMQTVQLTTGPMAEITGLIVDAAWQRKGVGRLLVEKAKEWSRKRNLPVLRVRSNLRRSDAHDFYNGLGFTTLKDQRVFETRL